MIEAAHRSAWLSWLATEKRYGDNTLDAYDRDLDDFSAFAAAIPATPSVIDRQIFRGWLAHMAARQLARTTIARRVSSLRGFYRCLLYTSPSPRDMRRSRMPSSA